MKEYFLKILCILGIHWIGRDDQGGMGDARTCDLCKYSWYPQFLSGHVLIHKRNK